MLSSEEQNRTHAYWPAIDGLRALAVVAVIVNHLEHGLLPSGFLGVDIFFVISGYVITASVRGRAVVPLGRFLLEFYERRMRRLAPALLVMTIVGVASIHLFDPDAEASTFAGIAALFGASNLFFYVQALDYFGAGAQLNMFSHTWSLGVEEQFYLCFPLLAHWTLVQRKPMRLAASVAVMAAASCFAFVLFYRSHQPAAYFLMPLRLWELGAGCLAALWLQGHPPTRGGRYDEWFGLLTAGALVAALWVPQRHAAATTLVVVLLSVLLIASLRLPGIVQRVFTIPSVVYVGKISYSLYLWHWYVICLSLWTIGMQRWAMPLQGLLTLFLAMLSYHVIEVPMRYGARRGRPAWTVAAGAAALGITALGLWGAHRHRLPAFSGDATERMVSAAPRPGYVAKYSRRSIDDCSINKIVSDTPSEFFRSLERCTAGESDAPRLIFAGDSHAMDLFPLADLIQRDSSASVTNLYQPGCQIPAPRVDANCPDEGALLRQLGKARLDRATLVLRNNYAPRELGGALAAYSSALERFLDRAAALGLRVVYFAPAPKYYALGPGRLCSVQWYRPSWALDPKCKRGFIENRAEQLARRGDFYERLIQLERQRSNFYVFDPFEALCGPPNGPCNPMRTGRATYRDSSHLTEFGSELLVEPFVEFLQQRGLIIEGHARAGD